MPSYYTAPSFKSKSFNCPHCNVFAKQYWGGMSYDSSEEDVYIEAYNADPSVHLKDLYYSSCEHCKGYSLWHFEKMIYPRSGNVPMPNIDMPEEIKKDYEEARSIAIESPRGAAALLRLCIQKLCIYLGEKGKSIDDDIESLCKKGLPVHVQQALDTVRVIGNESVHPGTIDLTDDPATAKSLFMLVNIVVEHRISNPKAIEALFLALPPAKLAAIKARSNK